MEDRLEHVKKKIKQAEVYYSRYNPRSDMMYDIEEARDDIRWLVYEIERLREENAQLRDRLDGTGGAR
jgi:regulator of replication initiation timing